MSTILRHTFCSHLVMRGAPMRAVQELVGHRDLTMTQRYSHLSPHALADAMRLLEDRETPAPDGENRGDGRNSAAQCEWLERVKWLGGRDSNPEPLPQNLEPNMNTNREPSTRKCERRGSYCAAGGLGAAGPAPRPSSTRPSASVTETKIPPGSPVRIGFSVTLILSPGLSVLAFQPERTR